jgi:hypothetical protein
VLSSISNSDTANVPEVTYARYQALTAPCANSAASIHATGIKLTPT